MRTLGRQGVTNLLASNLICCNPKLAREQRYNLYEVICRRTATISIKTLFHGTIQMET